MTEFRSDRESLLGVREERRGAERLEFREDKRTGQYILEGYAATYDPYEVHGGPTGGGWMEQLRSDAFDRTLADKPDVQLLINHTGTPLARTKSGTLKLTRDRHGLRVWASLDPSDPDVQALAPKMIRGDMDEMSFAFRVNDQTWDTSYTERTINALSLEKGDVSVVNYGMNPGTKAIISADAIGALASLSNKELVELRKLDQDQVKRAAAALMTISGVPVPPGLGTIAPSPAARAPHKKHKHAEAFHGGGGRIVVQPAPAPADDDEGHDDDDDDNDAPAGGGAPSGGGTGSGAPAGGATASRKDSPKQPYGNVPYADPGYKSDGRKRYPIDSAAHTKAAWSYINMPKNQKGYSSAQVASIKGRIKGAAKKFGIDISDDKKAAASMISHIDQVVRADGNTTLVAVMSDGSRVPLPAQRALPPGEARKGSFTGTEGWGDYNPSASPNDPHDEPYDMGMVGHMPNSGPVPDNIVGGSGAFTGTPKAQSHPPTSEEDPHDESIDEEMLAMALEQELLSQDHHDDPYDFGPYPGGSKVSPVHAEGPEDHHGDPYDVGPQVGSVPNDKPNVGNFPQGKVADNIVLTGAELGVGSGCDPGTPPSVGTAPVDGDARYDWTSGTIGQPGDPSEELDAGLRSSGSWAPTNIVAGKGGGDMEETDVDDDADDADEKKAAPIELDLCMAEALDKTIVHAYKKAGDNLEVRKLLAVARRQLTTMREIQPAKNTDISRKLSELRAEVGEPDTATVSGGLHYLRSMGTAPVGYGGLLDHDPQLHMVSPAERLAEEARQKVVRAREAATDADKAAERLKMARREAELNDVIRRRKLKAI